jgi:hypothetical protein
MKGVPETYLMKGILETGRVHLFLSSIGWKAQTKIWRLLSNLSNIILLSSVQTQNLVTMLHVSLWHVPLW